MKSLRVFAQNATNKIEEQVRKLNQVKGKAITIVASAAAVLFAYLYKPANNPEKVINSAEGNEKDLEKNSKESLGQDDHSEESPIKAAHDSTSQSQTSNSDSGANTGSGAADSSTQASVNNSTSQNPPSDPNGASGSHSNSGAGTGSGATSAGGSGGGVGGNVTGSGIQNAGAPQNPTGNSGSGGNNFPANPVPNGPVNGGPAGGAVGGPGTPNLVPVAFDGAVNVQRTALNQQSLETFAPVDVTAAGTKFAQDPEGVQLTLTNVAVAQDTNLVNGPIPYQASSVAIVNNAMVLTADTQALGQGAKDSVKVNYTVSDGVSNASAQVTFNITGVNDAPTGITFNSLQSIAENTINQTIANISVVDPDIGDQHVITLSDDVQNKFANLLQVTQKADGTFDIGLKPGATFDYEDASLTGWNTANFLLTITATDLNGNGLSFTPFPTAVTVTDQNDALVIHDIDYNKVTGKVFFEQLDGKIHLSENVDDIRLATITVADPDKNAAFQPQTVVFKDTNLNDAFDPNAVLEVRNFQQAP